MAVFPNLAKQRLLARQTALGFGASITRGAAVPQMASACGYHWLSIDMEHGSYSMDEAAQLCLAALPARVTPIVRSRQGALDEAVRLLDNGAQGIIVPNVDTAEQARSIVDALRFPPMGRRNWGISGIQFGYEVPAIDKAQAEMESEILIIAMIETAQSLSNAAAIAAVPGVDLLFIGGIDLSVSLGVPMQFGHPEMQSAFETVARACARHGKQLGMGGIYDQAHTRRCIEMGARFVAGGSDQAFMVANARARSQFIESCAVAG